MRNTVTGIGLGLVTLLGTDAKADDVADLDEAVNECVEDLLHSDEDFNRVGELVASTGLDLRSRFLEACVKIRSDQDVNCTVIDNAIIECE